ncbi:MAG: hypothetical protein ACREP9_13530 [Candidatus Dormibacteraceae bacterium]
MTLRYQAGQEIMLGDRVLFHGEPGEIDLIVEPSSTEPEHQWYVQEFGGGVGVREPKHFGRAFIQAARLPDTEDLEFVGRRAP